MFSSTTIYEPWSTTMRGWRRGSGPHDYESYVLREGVRASGIRKAQYWDVPQSYQATFGLIAIAISIVLSYVIPDPNFVGSVGMVANLVIDVATTMLLPVLVCLALYKFSHGKTISTAAAAPRGLTDEIDEIVHTYKRMLELKHLAPEGTGVRERINEYGRLAYLFIGECAKLPIVDASRSEFYRLQNEIQQEAKKLIEAGNNIISLVTNQRAENTLNSVRFIGIDEYAEQISIQTMAHRALSSGDGPAKGEEPIPPRPRKKMKAPSAEHMEMLDDVVARRAGLKARFVKNGDGDDVTIYQLGSDEPVIPASD